jgi:hypothetical protein
VNRLPTSQTSLAEHQGTLFSFAPLVEAKPKTTYINNRRYFGNKYKLLPFITSVVERECSDVKTVRTALSRSIFGCGKKNKKSRKAHF